MKKFKILLTICLMIGLSTLLTACSGKEKFKVEFIVNNDVYATINTNGNETITMPADPARDDYFFDGWCWDDNSWQSPFTANSLLGNPLSGNIKVYAKWNDINALEGTQAEFDGFAAVNASTYSVKVSNATKAINFSDIVSVNNKSSWKLTTDVQGNNVVASNTATLNAVNNTYYILVTAENGHAKLYTMQIRRRPLHLVTFNTSGGTAVVSQNIEEDTFATLPAEPTKDGYLFVNWDFDFGNPITKQTTITAVWQLETYTITYHLDGGTNYFVNPKNYTIESTTFTLLGAKKEGYIFDGWYEDDAFENMTEQIKKGTYGTLNLYAKWAATITFDSNGGTAVSPITQSFGTAVELPTPAKDGYIFRGWQLDGETYTLETMPKENTVLVAIWDYFSAGDGSQINPYQIKTKEELKSLAQLVNAGNNYSLNKYFELSGNVDLEATEWTPIGYLHSEYNYATTFRGNFDGKNFKIFNYKITKNNHVSSYDNATYTGLFGYTYKAEIKNLRVDSTMIVSSYTIVYAGGLVGLNHNSVIKNCYTTGNVNVLTYFSAVSASAGGLVGYSRSNSVIENCYAAGNVSVSANSPSITPTYSGGDLPSGNYYQTTITSNTTGSTVASGTPAVAYAGGLLGLNSDSIIKNCYATGNASVVTNLSAASALAGGLIANNHYGTISNCYATGNASASTSYSSSYAGGLIANNYYGEISNCFATGNASASANHSSYVGGLVGISDDAVITNCYRYNSQSFYRKDGVAEYNTASNSLATPCIATQLSLTSFYTNILKWDDEVWNFAGVNFGQEKMPTLKVFSVV